MFTHVQHSYISTPRWCTVGLLEPQQGRPCMSMGCEKMPVLSQTGYCKDCRCHLLEMYTNLSAPGRLNMIQLMLIVLDSCSVALGLQQT